MRRVATLAVLSATLLLGATAARQEVKQDKDTKPEIRDTPDEREKQRKALEGTWNVVSVRRAGKDLPADALQAAQLRYEFKADESLVCKGKDDLTVKATFKLEVEGNRWVINVTDSKNHVERGIYELQPPAHWYNSSGTLLLCTAAPGQERPTSFADKGAVLIRLRREVPPEPEGDKEPPPGDKDKEKDKDKP
jgi:uncharacterized protein (TIGR03067 family)